MVSPAVDARDCCVCLGQLDAFEHVALLEDGWAHVECADLVTMEAPC